MSDFGAQTSDVAELLAVPVCDVGDGDEATGATRIAAAMAWARGQILGAVSPALRAWIADLAEPGPASLADLLTTGAAWRIGARLHASDGATDGGLPHPVATWREQWLSQLQALTSGAWIPPEYADDQDPPAVAGFAIIDFERG
jgi:hypothetical protein